LGTERHEARRIDNQLRGRSGRQGDPGSSKFYISLEDDLMRLFGSDKLIGIMDTLGMQEGQVIEHPWINKSIEMAQKRVEAYNFEIRKQLLEYDDVMNKQREIIYSQRKMVLENPDVSETIKDMVQDLFESDIELFIQKNLNPDNWDFIGLENWLRAEFGPKIIIDRDKLLNSGNAQDAQDYLLGEITRAYEEKEGLIGKETMRHLERMITLQVVDMRWKEHLYAMDSLKEGIGLRAYGQKDPLIEYKNEGYLLFQQLVERIKKEIVEILFRIQAAEEKGFKAVFRSLPVELVHREFSGLSKAKFAQQRENIVPQSPSAEGDVSSSAGRIAKPDQPKVGRNDPCPCGSGKKYKKCCGNK
jgi:preprotein translocase subunit SecA